jgi:acetyltransferase-like isoleucine patch superfamily enzyme
MKKLFIQILKKLINKMNDIGVFEVLQKKINSDPHNNSLINVIVGQDCEINPSSIFIINENSAVVLEGKNYIGRNTEIQPAENGLIKIGFGTSIQDRNIILGDVEFGRFCLTAPNVYISSGRHYYNLDPLLYIKDQDEIVKRDSERSAKHSKKVTIEDDVWIGINSVIMSGITIGRGSVIGSNSVVTKDVPPFSIMAGNPAIEIKRRLNLKSKDLISFDNKMDYPNFYRGFYLDRNNVEESIKSGGIYCGLNFIVYMNNKKSKLEITMKSLIDLPITICYHNQEITIENSQFMKIIFDSKDEFFHEFHIKSNQFISSISSCLLVKKIEIK